MTATEAAAGRAPVRLAERLRRYVAELELDLTNVVVLTEAATGPYVVTPALAALAGAEVLAYSKSTRHGTVAEVRAETQALLDRLPSTAGKVRFVDELSPAIVGSADVITNSGHLRPLDEAIMRHAKPTVVVPLMYEAWEFRDADLDLEYLKSRGIRVGATNERHPDIDVFGFLGEMAIKQIHDAGLAVRGNRFVLFTNNDFGPYLARTLAPMCFSLGVIDTDEHKDRYAGLDIDWLGGFPTLEPVAEYRDAAGLVVAAYPFDQTWIGPGGPVPAETVAARFPTVVVLRYAGDVDASALVRAGVEGYPAEVASGHMGVLPSALGPEPIIRLQGGGLKSAQAMLSGDHDYRGIPVVELM